MCQSKDATITLDIAYIPSGAASDEMGKEREEGKESPDDDELDDHDEEGDLNRTILLRKKAVKIIAKAAYRENIGKLFKDISLRKVDEINRLEIATFI